MFPMQKKYIRGWNLFVRYATRLKGAVRVFKRVASADSRKVTKVFFSLLRENFTSCLLALKVFILCLSFSNYN
nr:MAG: hypothetical protein [Microvirus Sku115]